VFWNEIIKHEQKDKENLPSDAEEELGLRRFSTAAQET
jgi:hypothetical protein